MAEKLQKQTPQTTQNPEIIMVNEKCHGLKN